MIALFVHLYLVTGVTGEGYIRPVVPLGPRSQQGHDLKSALLSPYTPNVLLGEEEEEEEEEKIYIRVPSPIGSLDGDGSTSGLKVKAAKAEPRAGQTYLQQCCLKF